MSFGGEDLYPSVVEKASARAFSVVVNHPFMDGNKRAGHAMMETFLVLNGFEIAASTADQEKVMLQLASGELSRLEFAEWLRESVVRKTGS